MFDTIDSRWPDPVQKRLADLSAHPERLNTRVASINGAAPLETRNRLLSMSMKSTKVAQRIFWLRREADLVIQASVNVVACKSGCSACCKIGVMVSEAEAAVIAQEIGMPVAEPPANVCAITDLELGLDEAMERNAVISDEFFNTPCSFLNDEQQCGIYQHRPMACRHQINLDDDPLLCQLEDGGGIPVPYLNMTASKTAYLMALGPNKKMADIRHFFPATVTRSWLQTRNAKQVGQ